MKLFSFYTPSHGIFKDRWFLPSLREKYELIFEECPQECEAAEFMAGGWLATMMRKVDLIIRAIQGNFGEVFIYSDMDVQFFRPMRELILRRMAGNDMAIQQNAPLESPAEQLCAGFFACRANRKTLNLWRTVRDCVERLGDSGPVNEQSVLNGLLAGEDSQLRWMLNRFRGGDSFPGGFFFLKKFFARALISRITRCRNFLNWEFLPREFFGGGVFTGKIWNPGEELEIPDNIILHHANWTVGVRNKVAQLEYVQEKVRQRELCPDLGG
ncbi:MAG TPA: putative nucleotide-diphospho-sugar transferase [Candidatus Omnitrophota bacterium]|nr:putative nucleotide-diphospho-sugar transferase [Candidatus Omnitrophota bacterium]